MNITTRLDILKQWFELYDDFLVDMDMGCEKGCASCCTCNVTCTTLEGQLIYDQLAAKNRLDNLDAKVASAPERRFQPAITLNQMVEMCVHDLEIPEEINDPSAGTCLWLDEETCPLYAVRPFACRAMCSVNNCTATGEAQMPPFVLSVNNVMNQYIEALDRPGASGNLIDILHFLSIQDNRQAYIDGSQEQFPAPLKPNLPFSVLMIPPEHRERMTPLLQAIQQSIKPSE